MYRDIRYRGLYGDYSIMIIKNRRLYYVCARLRAVLSLMCNFMPLIILLFMRVYTYRQMSRRTTIQLVFLFITLTWYRASVVGSDDGISSGDVAFDPGKHYDI